MRTMYVLVPDVASGKAIADDLQLARIDRRRIHVLAKEGTRLDTLSEARIAQRSDLIPALEGGAAIGGLTGVLLGLAIITAPPAGLVLDGSVFIGMAVFGIGFGAWVSSMIGVRLPNRRLTRFDDAIARGLLLMIIDVPAARVREIADIVMRQHPEVEVERRLSGPAAWGS